MPHRIEKWLNENFKNVWSVVGFVLKWRIAFVLTAFFFYVKYDKQNDLIMDLQSQVLEMQKTNIQLLSQTFLAQKNLDRVPFSIWKKQKIGNSFVMKFINATGDEQMLIPEKIDRFFYYNKTDFAVFPYSEAIKFYREDSLVANAKTDTIAHFDTDFTDAAGNKKITDGYTRWREVVENDTFIWGKMDKYYKPEIIKK